MGAVKEIMDYNETLARYYAGDDDVISVIALACPASDNNPTGITSHVTKCKLEAYGKLESRIRLIEDN